VQANTNNYTIQSFDQKAFTHVSSITLNDLQDSPFAFACSGASGLGALNLAGPDSGVPGMVYLIQDSTYVINVSAADLAARGGNNLIRSGEQCRD
jgi:hypothetical protein